MKDAKGHGSDPRGAHAGGTDSVGKRPLNLYDVAHPIYQTRQKMPGYNGPQSPMSANYNTSGRMLRQRMGGLGKQDHLDMGDQHAQIAGDMDAAHRNVAAIAEGKLGGANPGPLISGSVSTKFSQKDQDNLRTLAGGASDHTGAAMAHYAAAGIRNETARTRLRANRDSR